MSADYAVQKALRQRLAATSLVTDLVAAESILDRNSRPAPNPSIIIGEGQSVDGGRVDRSSQDVFVTLHIWQKESGLVGVKAIAGAVRKAVNAGRLDLEAPYYCGDCFVSDSRFLRDPDGETAHGVVTVEARVVEH
jgi:hypothetical protein